LPRKPATPTMQHILRFSLIKQCAYINRRKLETGRVGSVSCFYQCSFREMAGSLPSKSAFSIDSILRRTTPTSTESSTPTSDIPSSVAQGGAQITSLANCYSPMPRQLIIPQKLLPNPAGLLVNGFFFPPALGSLSSAMPVSTIPSPATTFAPPGMSPSVFSQAWSLTKGLPSGALTTTCNSFVRDASNKPMLRKESGGSCSTTVSSSSSSSSSTGESSSENELEEAPQNGPTRATRPSPPLSMKDRTTKKARTSFTESQIEILETEFEKQKYLSRRGRTLMAKRTGLTEKHVKTWFQNRRTKWKKSFPEEVCIKQKELAAISIYRERWDRNITELVYYQIILFYLPSPSLFIIFWVHKLFIPFEIYFFCLTILATVQFTLILHAD